MVDIILVNPPYPSAVQKYVGSAPPLGLAYLAAVARDLGLKVRILDMNVEKLSIDDAVEIISREDPLILGVTCTTPSYPRAISLIKYVKRVKPNTVTIMGGPHVTFTHLEVMEEVPEVDVIVRGEGEITFKELCTHYFFGEIPLREIRGITFRIRGEVFVNPDREPITDLDKLPFPAWDLLDLAKYGVAGEVAVPILTSRGCPYSCVFCSSSKLFGKKYRARSPKNVVDEVEYLYRRFGIRQFGIIDDIFTLDRRRAKRIAEEIIERGLEVTWACSSRVDTVDHETLVKLREAGCATIYFGVESGCQEIVDWYGKGIRLEKVPEVLKMCKDLGFITVTSFILGAPYDNWYTIGKTIEFAKKLNPDYAQFTLLTPYPGTYLWEFARKNNLIVDWNLEHYDTLHPVMKTFYLSARDLAKALAKAYIAFYGSFNFIAKILKRRGKAEMKILWKAFYGVFKELSNYIKLVIVSRIGKVFSI
ncbi:MAG: B12-binding domain-containing radical SAM protein [Thermoprotei archaeon]|nr:MAG: B12-binding domain-containing radical SAM protein [Thermoprotei archaeon]